MQILLGADERVVSQQGEMMEQVFVLTLSDVLTIAVGVLMLGVWVLVLLIKWWQQSRCKHDSGVNETQACVAICRKCGKNLGFIGSWRKRSKGDIT